MLEYLKNETNIAFIENGALTYSSTKNECLDLFGTIGALRHASDDEILTQQYYCFDYYVLER